MHQQFNTALIKLACDIGLWYVKAAELCVSNPNSKFEFTKLIRIGIVIKTKGPFGLSLLLLKTEN